MTDSLADGDWVPDACTLPTAAQPVRTAEFDRFFAESVRSMSRSAPTLLELVLPAGVGAVARDLAARESSCCSFFDFGFTPAADILVMRIGVPDSYVEVLDALAARVHAVLGGAR